MPAGESYPARGSDGARIDQMVQRNDRGSLGYDSAHMSMARIPINSPDRHLKPVLTKVSERIEAVVRSGRWLMGSETASFEAAFAAYCGVPYCLGIGNGTDGLELALTAAETRGGEVIGVANAGGYTTTACRLVGATPVYVDVDDDTLVLDPNGIEPMLSPNTRAVVVTHLFGNVVDTREVRSALARAGRSDVVVIEDCSQAHGATIADRIVGGDGDISVFSFYPTKNLGALGDAGAVTSRDSTTHDRLVALHQYGWTARYQSSVPYGRNSRMDEIQAAVLNVKLPHLDSWNDERRSIVERYATALSESSLELVTSIGDGGAAHLAIVRSQSRDQLRVHLDAAGIDSDVHYPALDFEQLSQQGLPDRRSSLVTSEAARDEILTVPCFPGMESDEIERVANALASFDGGSK